MRTIRWIASATALATYGLIVLGGVVRITGSGMGCGDHWPLCNGRLIPELGDLLTVIEWSHRLAALVVSVLVAALAAAAWAHRNQAGVAGPAGPLRPALAAVIVLIAQILLGAVTVWLRLPAVTVTLHLATAMALLSVVMIAGLRAGPDRRTAFGPGRRPALIAASVGAVAILLGAVTASTGAGHACQGFPLCNGAVWPAAESGLPAIQWTHRLAAYTLVLFLVTRAVGPARGHPAVARRYAGAALGLATAQVAVAAAMVLLGLPAEWRALHISVGTALWSLLVLWVWAASRPAGAASGVAGP